MTRFFRTKFPRYTMDVTVEEAALAVREAAVGRAVEGDASVGLAERFARTVGVAHALPVSSGRFALELILHALELKPADEIVVPAYNYYVVPLLLRRSGLVVRFGDVDPPTRNMTPAEAERRLTRRTRAILVTHMLGNPCDMPGFVELCRARKLLLIEDCAHAAGAAAGGRPAGSFGEAALFSLSVQKCPTAFGGGVAVTPHGHVHEAMLRAVAGRRPRAADVIRTLAFGISCLAAATPALYSVTAHPLFAASARLGFPLADSLLLDSPDRPKGRGAGPAALSNAQAALALAQLGRLDRMVEARRGHAGRYAEALGNDPRFELPGERAGDRHAFLYYLALAKERNRLTEALLAAGVDCEGRDFVDCSSRDEHGRRRSGASSCPNAAILENRSLRLPSSSALSPAQVEEIAQRVALSS
jgi:dTDP-4-amino-4,6-dideoxygalactose transaminase